MKKPIILATAFAWATAGIHGADEGYTSHNYNPGGSHTEEHASHNYNPGGHHEGSSESESAHHSEAAAEEKKLATALREFAENALVEAKRLQEENKEIFAGGTPPGQLGFKNSYESHEVHGKLDNLISTLKELAKISTEHSL